MAILEFIAALPRLVAALERLCDVQTARLAQERKELKDEALDELIDRAAESRRNRVRDGEAQRDAGVDREQPEGV